MSEEATVTIANYPPSGVDVIFRTLGFGPIGSKAAMLIEMEDAPGDDMALSITVGNGPENAELAEFLRIIGQMLTNLADSAVPHIDAAIDAEGGES